ncbi:MAG TPA: hypothetical protein VJ724_11200, partial [Tahibacter sp.]|nr:hypothetical protein [Tahibacter sp.]
MRPMLARVCAALLFAVLVLSAPARATERVVVDRWTTADGLPSDTINRVARDRDGFLLVATETDVARFDGRTFRTLDDTAVAGLVAGTPLDIDVEPSGDFWIASIDGGIQHVAGNVAQAIMPPGFPATYIAMRIARGRDGVLWFGTSQGLVRVERTGAGVRSRVVDATRARWISFVAPDAAGGVHFRDRGDSALRYLDASGKVVPSRWANAPDGSPVLEFWTFPDGRRLFLTTRGLHRNDGDAIGPALAFDGAGALSVYHAAIDRHGVVWLGTRNAGVLRLFPDAPDRLVRFAAVGDDTPTHDIHVDANGDVWLATASRGLVRVREPRIAAYGEAEGIVGGSVDTVLETAGAVWVGTNDGLFRRPHGAARFSAVPELAGASVKALAADARGGVLAGGNFNRLVRIGEAVESFDMPVPGGKSNVVLALATGPARTLVGTIRGLYAFDGKTVAPLPGLDDDGVKVAVSIVADGPDDFWVAGAFGVRRLSAGRFVAFAGAERLPQAMALSLHVEPDGRLLVGYARRGLAVLDRGNVALFDATNGFPTSAVHSIHADDDGGRWIGSNRGLYRIDLASLARPGWSRGNPMPYAWFGAADGLPSEALGLQTVAGGGRDTLWLATDGGVAAV